MTVPTATIVGPLTYPGTGRPVRSRSVTVECVGPPGALLRDSGGGIVGSSTITTDITGSFAVTVALNSDIDEASGVGPPGTYWRFTVGTRPAVSWLCRLDADDDGKTIPAGSGPPWRIIDPTPRGWVPLEGPASTEPGPEGPEGPQGAPGSLPPGPLANRPAATAVPPGTIHVADDATPAVSVSDGSVWVPVDVARSRVLGGFELGSYVVWDVPASPSASPVPGVVTPDIDLPDGLVRVSVVGITSTTGAMTEPLTDAFFVRYSDDGGSTWDDLPTVATFSMADSALFTQRPSAPTSWVMDGTGIVHARFALLCAIAAGKTAMKIVAGMRIIVEAM